MHKVLVIVGPTACGKSALAVRLAREFNGEVINGDSVQVYKYLNIGSAKTTAEEMDGIPHHLIDYVEPDEDYSVQRFQKEAREKIEEICSRGKLPVVVGGTGLYIKALLYDYEFRETQNENQYGELTNQQLYDLLRERDPVAAEKIHVNNRKRLVRALQICDSGFLKSEAEESQKHEMIYDTLILGTTMDRVLLRQRISERVDRMFEEGLESEVEGLYERYDFSLKAFQAIGYKEFVPYFKGNKSMKDLKKDIVTHTNQFMKRQYTWWNNQMDVDWLDISEEDFHERAEEKTAGWLNGQTV